MAVVRILSFFLSSPMFGIRRPNVIGVNVIMAGDTYRFSMPSISLSLEERIVSGYKSTIKYIHEEEDADNPKTCEGGGAVVFDGREVGAGENISKIGFCEKKEEKEKGGFRGRQIKSGHCNGIRFIASLRKSEFSCPGNRRQQVTPDIVAEIR